jgi:hypothetical protein
LVGSQCKNELYILLFFLQIYCFSYRSQNKYFVAKIMGSKSSVTYFSDM